MGDPRFFHLAYPGGGRHTLEQQQKEGRPLERRECETRYELAAAILPSRLRRIAMELPETDKRRAEEFRLRAGHCLSVLLPEGERPLNFPATPPSKHYGRGFFRCGVASGWDFAAPLW